MANIEVSFVCSRISGTLQSCSKWRCLISWGIIASAFSQIDGVSSTIVPDSGTERLRGLKGQGEFAVGHEPPYNMTLDYGFGVRTGHR